MSPDYEDQHFYNSSLDIVTTNRKPEYNSGLDSNFVKNMIQFNEAYRKYFPEGIKMFSSINEIGWVYYPENPDFNPVNYIIKTKEGKDYYISLSDSLSFYQKQSSADFLMVFNGLSIMIDAPKKSNQNSPEAGKYAVGFDGSYSIWDLKKSELVVEDNVKSTLKFDNITKKLPFRSAVLTLAHDIYEKLPMFEK